MEKPPQHVSHNEEKTKEGQNVEIYPADISEIAALVALDEQIFLPTSEDPFTESQWRSFESFWIVRDGKKVGSFSFCPNKDVWNPPEADAPPDREGSLYLVSTGILHEYQGQGIGNKVREWQIAYAKQKGFSRIVTNHRQNNARIIHLSEKYGFKKIADIPHYYHDPDESAVVMELQLDKEVG